MPQRRVIAEVGQAHDGSLGTAHAYVDAVADAGADGVKFQTHLAAHESTPGEPWRVPFSRQDASRYDYWRRMEFDEPGWQGLREHAHERGLLFVSSPFSPEAVELLRRVGVDAWKVASGEVGNLALIDRMLEDDRPIWLSSGMSDRAELDRTVAHLVAAGRRPTILQCTSSYPTPPELVGLNLIADLAERYACPVGLSDHSGTIFPSLAAVTLGAELLEVHVTLSRHAFGPDVPASVTIEELATLVTGVRFLERALASPVDKDRVAQDLAPMRRLFTRSVVARRSLAAGSRLTAEDLVAKKPGTGIPAERLADLVGRTVVRDVAADELLAPSDVDPPA